jgi:hypothetical protein
LAVSAFKYFNRLHIVLLHKCIHLCVYIVKSQISHNVPRVPEVGDQREQFGRSEAQPGVLAVMCRIFLCSGEILSNPTTKLISDN